MGQQAIRREKLLSLEEGYPSMGKMAGPSNGGDMRGTGPRPMGSFELVELRFRKRMEEGLEEHHCLPEAGVQIIVHRVQQFPVALWAE